MRTLLAKVVLGLADLPFYATTPHEAQPLGVLESMNALVERTGKDLRQPWR